uniref:UDP-N-acetylglucosamine transferase subunit ALG14 n=1 Tax=Arundo donax TaxID=35708 RepID=A0A0A9AY83_ARUDO
MQIYRSREVGQSYITSIATTLLATLHAMWLVIRIRPQVIFCNGPGTCFPLCISAFVLKVLGLGWSSIFYIESIARVKKLSLSGLLLYKLRIADQFFVQWPQLQKKTPSSTICWPFDVNADPYRILGCCIFQLKIQNTLTISVYFEK